jgi:hypothetical protein
MSCTDLLVTTEQLADADSCACNRADGLVEAMKNDEKENSFKGFAKCCKGTGSSSKGSL